MTVVVVASDSSRRRALIQRAEEVGWTVRADVPAEADLTPEDLDGVAVLIVDTADAHPTSPRDNPSHGLVDPLTSREREVLERMSDGLSNRQIAAALDISEHTVKFHVSAVLGKLGVSSRSAAIRHAMRQGLVTL